jgi:hypothetical protein
MGREDITELLKNGPSLKYVAEMLNVSRPTLYRQIEYYRNSEDSKMNKVVKDYFDMLVMGRITTEEEARKHLEQIQYFAEAKKELDRMTLDKAYEDYHIAVTNLRYNSRNMTSREKVEEQEKIDKMEKDLRALEEQLDIEPSREWYSQMPVRMEWNKGDIRTACYCNADVPRVYIDADYDVCRNITVELLVEISGSDFSFARFRPQEDARFVDLGSIGSGPNYKYLVKWTENDKVRTAGPFEIDCVGIF